MTERYACLLCGQYHDATRECERCRVCGNLVLMIIQRGTGLCCGNCQKIDKGTLMR